VREFRNPLFAYLCVALVCLGSAGCELSTDPDTRIISGLDLVSGDGQTGAPGSTLSAPLVVRVVDLENRGISGVRVAWEVVSGDGSVAPALTSTDANGNAATLFTLGATPGVGGVRAYVAEVGAENLEVFFGATGNP